MNFHFTSSQISRHPFLLKCEAIHIQSLMFLWTLIKFCTCIYTWFERCGVCVEFFTQKHQHFLFSHDKKILAIFRVYFWIGYRKLLEKLLYKQWHHMKFFIGIFVARRFFTNIKDVTLTLIYTATIGIPSHSLYFNPTVRDFTTPGCSFTLCDKSLYRTKPVHTVRNSLLWRISHTIKMHRFFL